MQRRAVQLLQDHERCLWTGEARDAMDEAGLELLTRFPKCSQDLNPIEDAWREFKVRLADSQPATLETRDEFVARLRSAVAWVNRNRRNLFMRICNSQVERANDVIQAKGGRTKH